MDALRFEEWMQQALQDPHKGYYRSGANSVGRSGDFSTSATTSAVLGAAIAGWLKEEAARQRGVRAVIEIGGGDGSLSAQVCDSLGWWHRRKRDWCMVETSAPLRGLQQQRPRLAGARWFENVNDALAACGGRAFIFHNELVDAFPVRVLQWHEAARRWDELWLRRGPDAWQEELRPADIGLAQPAEHAALSPVNWGTQALRDGQRIELHGSYLRWLRGLAPAWSAGAMLTVDYGDSFPRLYHRRPRGTLRAYLRHQRLHRQDVYANMGRQDITADVNFSDLMNWSEPLGWEAPELCTQREFLERHVPAMVARAVTDPAIAHLTDAEGAGGAFKVLVQRVRDRG